VNGWETFADGFLGVFSSPLFGLYCAIVLCVFALALVVWGALSICFGVQDWWRRRKLSRWQE